MIGNLTLLGHLGRLVNRGDLRDADARNDPRGADRSRPDADLHGVGPGGDQILAPLGRGHVAGHDVDVPLLLNAPDGFDDVGRMPVGAVDHQHVHALADQALDPLVIVDADGGTRPQPPLPIFAGLRKPPHHVDVFDRNQSCQSEIFVNQQKLLHLFCHQNLLSFLKRYSPRRGDQILTGHHLGNRQVPVFEEAEVAAGDNAHQPAIGRGDWQARRRCTGS